MSCRSNRVSRGRNTETSLKQKNVSFRGFSSPPKHRNEAGVSVCFGVSEDTPYRTYRDVIEAAKSRQPKHCPACGSDAIAPTFDGEQWACDSCFDVWNAADGQG